MALLFYKMLKSALREGGGISIYLPRNYRGWGNNKWTLNQLSEGKRSVADFDIRPT